MASYVYRFDNKVGKLLYIGKTNNMDRRMEQHFGGKGHIKGTCYRDTSKIYYMKVNTEADALMVEQYLIGKYKPLYNKLGKSKSDLTLHLNMREDWKLYKSIDVGFNLKSLLDALLLVGGIVIMIVIALS